MSPLLPESRSSYCMKWVSVHKSPEFIVIEQKKTKQQQHMQTIRTPRSTIIDTMIIIIYKNYMQIMSSSSESMCQAL
jgi:hypothetical protein